MPHSPPQTSPACCSRAAFGLLAAVLLAACTREPTRIDPAEFVDAQRSQVATDRISAADGRGLDRLVSGFRQVDAEGEPALELVSRAASLEFYSLAGDPARAVELDVSYTGKAKPRMRLHLNQAPLGRQRIRAGRRTYRVELPADRLRDGINDLEIGLRPARLLAFRQRTSPLRIHAISFPSTGGRPSRAAGSDEIVRRGETPGSLEMPIASRLDLTARLPREAVLEGAYALRLPGDSRDRQATAALTLSVRDDDGTTIVERIEASTSVGGDLHVDLTPWGDRLARLRFELTGTTNGVLRLEGAEISGRASPGEPAIAPQGLEAPPQSARLSKGGPPDVLVIVLDAARADAFSVYGGEAATPAIDALAAAGTRFTHARAPSSWTGQSMPALFTGLYPDSVGVEHWGSRIPPTAPTLAALFEEAGYRTVLWTQHPFYRSHRTLMGGFDAVIFGRKGDPEHLPEAAELFPSGGTEDRRPLYAVVHLMPPHAPYEPPPPFRGSLTAGYEGHVRLEPTFLNSFPKRRDPARLSEEDVLYIRRRYLENGAYADHLVGRVLELYRAAGRLDDAVVVLLSDHGEAFLEHDRFLHGLHLWREYVHIPLVIRWPQAVRGFQPLVEAPASLIDLAPTLVDGLALPSGIGFQGRSLLPAVFSGVTADRPLYAYTRGISDGTRPPRPEYRIESGEWAALLQEPEGRTRLLHRDDLLEQADRAAEQPTRALLLEQTARLQAALNARILETLGAAESEELDAETIEQLRALGYLQ